MKSQILLNLVLLLCLSSVAHAQSPIWKTAVSRAVSPYRLYKDIAGIDINVPTVIEVPLTEPFIEHTDVAIANHTTRSFQPYFLKREVVINEVPLTMQTDRGEEARRMNDGDSRTYMSFELPENTSGRVSILIASARPVTSSALTLLLPQNVALPNTVEIRAGIGNSNALVVARRTMDQQTINFPETTADSWRVTLDFGQPLRIGELRLHQDNATRTTMRAVRFLAHPGHTYRLYYDPDHVPESPATGEAGNLASASDVLVLPTPPSNENPDYRIADSDADGVSDIRDNCISVVNPDQTDINGNGRGDSCDDFDQDQQINAEDNCPDNPNRHQEDRDSDGIGDVCDDQESRITEQYSWLPWVGIGVAALVIATLFLLTARGTPKASAEEPQ